jgi:hypothetical protein
MCASVVTETVVATEAVPVVMVVQKDTGVKMAVSAEVAVVSAVEETAMRMI